MYFREKEKQDLKSKLSELEDFKTKYEAEKKENEVKETTYNHYVIMPLKYIAIFRLYE